ncbi:CBS domain-containing protein [Noviherbaspirillum galbum]|uniref:CBS domain-containing protein n=1 Tax=Noviherbaspirillum galbum TaxID=2709383 RepID=A0A6B3SP97_9BURK|nr:CBS domain-containing protein [Noviherbaspirillum galbum]NEX62338.1 CBS domain-containing protein [Noviherbaspirillum galbum]
MKVEDVMTRHLVCVKEGDPIRNAIERMLRYRISGLPVLNDDGRLVGILTEGDLLRRTETETERKRPRWLEFLLGPDRLAKEYQHTHGRRVGEVMTAQPVTVTPDKPLDDVVHLMEKHRINRVPVVKDDQLVGIVSRANLLLALDAVLRDVPPGATGDDDIRRQLWHAMKEASWLPRGAIDVLVRNGVVFLNGVLMSEEEIKALSVIAENIPGVKEVRNRVVWCEPMSGMVFQSTETSQDTA